MLKINAVSRLARARHRGAASLPVPSGWGYCARRVADVDYKRKGLCR
ncbi:MAG: hypothetical protein K2M61_01280 [Muribaculaceae bacterium]|nr:hypothetical protein [Muribaculaceae bacterium]